VHLNTRVAHATRVMTMGEVASSIAHEVNQPLGAIINYANACLRILKGGSGDLTGVTTALSAVVKDAERAAAVIARVRALAKKSPPEMVAVEVRDIISDVLALSSRRIDFAPDRTHNRTLLGLAADIG